MSGVQSSLGSALPRLVMFDLDGTLVDSVPDLAAAVDSMLTSLGRAPAGLDQVRHWVGNGARVLVRRALAGGIEHAAIGEEETEQALALFMQAYSGGHAATEVYPGVVDTLKWLRKHEVELALITNKPEQFVGPLLDEMKLGKFFRWIVGGDTLPQQKPDPAALLFVMKMAGVAPEESLFVGDSRNDVLAAKAAGVRSVGLTYGYNHGRPIAEEQPTLVLDDLRQLLPCFDTGNAIVLPSTANPPAERDRIVQETAPHTLWMKVIKALARWRWRA